jgi:hypothetical protein
VAISMAKDHSSGLPDLRFRKVKAIVRSAADV